MPSHCIGLHLKFFLFSPNFHFPSVSKHVNFCIVIKDSLAFGINVLPLICNSPRKIPKTDAAVCLSMTPLLPAFGKNTLDATNNLFWCRFFGVPFNNSGPFMLYWNNKTIELAKHILNTTARCAGPLTKKDVVGTQRTFWFVFGFPPSALFRSLVCARFGIWHRAFSSVRLCFP